MCALTPEGDPKPLPEQLVPSSYAEWDVTVYDWQVQWSCSPDGPPFPVTFRKLMPVVGCQLEDETFDTANYTLFSTSTSLPSV